MAKFNQSVLTNQGRALITDLIGNKGKSKFTKAVTSDKVYSPDSLQGLTSIDQVKQTKLVSSVTVVDPSRVDVEIPIDNTDVTTDYYVQTVGLYCTDTNGEEVLYSVATAQVADLLPAFDGKSSAGLDLTLTINVGNASNVNLVADPAAALGQGDKAYLLDQIRQTAVGTNLLTGTGYHTVTGSTGSVLLSNETSDDLLTLFKGLEGETVTASVDYKYSGFVAGTGPNHLGWEIGIVGDSTSWVGLWYSPNNGSGSGRISSTFVVPKNVTSIKEGFGNIGFPGGGTGALSHFKLEKGSVATDWCPNPTEILTQSDYAKIKAAIVALGGALS